jgi:hypothetical protein
LKRKKLIEREQAKLIHEESNESDQSEPEKSEIENQ